MSNAVSVSPRRMAFLDIHVVLVLFVIGSKLTSMGRGREGEGRVRGWTPRLD